MTEIDIFEVMKKTIGKPDMEIKEDRVCSICGLPLSLHNRKRLEQLKYRTVKSNGISSLIVETSKPIESKVIEIDVPKRDVPQKKMTDVEYQDFLTDFRISNNTLLEEEREKYKDRIRKEWFTWMYQEMRDWFELNVILRSMC